MLQYVLTADVHKTFDTCMKPKVTLKNINLDKVYHPDDLADKDRLDGVPGFRATMSNVVCPLREKWINVQYLGNGLHSNESSLRELDEQLINVCKVLGADKVPSLSMMWSYHISATTEGAKSPHVTTLSGAIDLLDDDELDFVLGHEVGHQILGHKPYHMFLECLYLPIIDLIPGGEKWLSLVRMRLLHWYRVSDFSADRMALLACQDINVALRTLVKMSGIPKKYYDVINIDSFIKQAEEFDAMFQGKAESAIKNMSLNIQSKPWLVKRAAELLKWYNSGEYDNILNDNKV